MDNTHKDMDNYCVHVALQFIFLVVCLARSVFAIDRAIIGPLSGYQLPLSADSVHNACRDFVSDVQCVDLLHFLVELGIKRLGDAPVVRAKQLPQKTP